MIRRMMMASLNSSASPVGREFNVGTGSGILVINGADQTKPWYPLQDNDKFIIAAGSYSNINIQNLTKITKVQGVNETDVTTQYGTISNATGLVVSNIIYKDAVQRCLVISSPLKDVTITDCEFVNNSNYSIHLDGKAVLYPNKAAENLKILNTEFNGSGTIYLEAQLNYSIDPVVDNGFVDGLEVANCYFHDRSNLGTLLMLDNGLKYKVHDNLVRNINLTVVPNTLHARLFFCKGLGDIYNNRAENYYGNLGVQWLFTRGSVPATTRMYNNIGIDSQFYSLLEVQTPANLIGPTVTFANPEISYNTAINMGLHPNLSPTSFPCVVVDVYVLNGGRAVVRNNVGVNVLAEGNQFRGYNFVINPSGPTIAQVTQSNNLPLLNMERTGGYASYTDAGYLNTSDLKISSVSPLKGSAVPISEIPRDYYNHLRSVSTPSIGAVEDIV